MTEEKIRIAVIDDHPLYREGVVSTLSGHREMEVVAQGASAEEALKIAEELLPDIMLLDIQMRGNGLVCASEISKKYPVTKTIILTVSEDGDDILEAFQSGARGYVVKGVSGSELSNIVRSVYAGETYVTPTLASQVLSEMSKSKETPPSEIESLTPRENQILERVASGDLNKEIAFDLGISEKTVKHYMTNIMQKLHARNRVEAALLAHDAGLGKRKEPLE